MDLIEPQLKSLLTKLKAKITDDNYILITKNFAILDKTVYIKNENESWKKSSDGIKTVLNTVGLDENIVVSDLKNRIEDIVDEYEGKIESMYCISTFLTFICYVIETTKLFYYINVNVKALTNENNKLKLENNKLKLANKGNW